MVTRQTEFGQACILFGGVRSHQITHEVQHICAAVLSCSIPIDSALLQVLLQLQLHTPWYITEQPSGHAATFAKQQLLGASAAPKRG